MNVVKTKEGHIALFQSNELQNNLKCTQCDFVATYPVKLKRHMIKHNPKPEKVEEKCPKCDKTFKCKSELNRHIPTSHSDYVKGNSRANQYRKLKKLNVPKAHQFETCTEKDLITMIEKADVSQNQLLKLLAVLRKRFGRKAFEPNLAKKMREHLNSFDDDFETTSTTFQCKDGKDVKSSLSTTKDVNQFLNRIAELRELRKPKVILGLDGDVRHLMITGIVKESDEHDETMGFPGQQTSRTGHPGPDIQDIRHPGHQTSRTSDIQDSFFKAIFGPKITCPGCLMSWMSDVLDV